MAKPYVIQAAILVPVAFILLLLFLRQVYVALIIIQVKRDAKRKQDYSWDSRGIRSIRRSSAMKLLPEDLRAATVLKNFRQNALLCGTLNCLVMILYSLDSGRVNGIWNDIIVTTLFSKILTLSTVMMVVSYVVAVTSASYTATQLNQPEPENWYRLMAYSVSFLCLTALVTTILSAMGVAHKDTYRPYLALTVIIELVCIGSFSVAYFPFIRAVQHVHNLGIESAISDMRRMFAMMMLFLVVGPPYQVWYIIVKAEDRADPHDPDSYEIKDQFALYFVFFITMCALYAVWQRLPNLSPSSPHLQPTTPTHNMSKPSSARQMMNCHDDGAIDDVMAEEQQTNLSGTRIILDNGTEAESVQP